MKNKPLFPQSVRVVNYGLKCAKIADDVAVISTGLCQIRVPLAWWLAHQHEPCFELTVSGVETNKGEKR